MPSSFRLLADWYHRPEQELLRRELAWFVRWIRRPMPFLVFLALFLAIFLFRLNNHYALKVAASGKYPPSSLSWWIAYILGLGEALAVFMLLGFLLRRRTLAIFAKGRLVDLVLSDLGPKELWPALLVSPIIAMWVIATYRHLVALVFAVIQPQFPQEYDAVGATLWRNNQQVLYSLLAFLKVVVRLMWPASGLISKTVHWSALTTTICSLTLPHRTRGRLLLGFLLSLFLTGDIPQFLLSLFLFSSFSASIASSAYLGASSVAGFIFIGFPTSIVMAWALVVGGRWLFVKLPADARASAVLPFGVIACGIFWQAYHALQVSWPIKFPPFHEPTLASYIERLIILPVAHFLFDLILLGLAFYRLRDPKLWTTLREQAARD